MSIFRRYKQQFKDTTTRIYVLYIHRELVNVYDSKAQTMELSRDQIA